MNVSLYKIDDIIKFEFLKIPKALFANASYKSMSSDAKLTYSLLYDRLSLSKQNNWINENNEVYLIYTRENIAEELGISYKKAIAAFKELTQAKLIFEKRCGRGMANRVFIVKPEVTVADAKKYVKSENLRTADMECLDEETPVGNFDNMPLELLNENFKNCDFSISKTAETAYQELPNSHPIKTDSIKTYFNNTDNSQSFSQNSRELKKTGRTNTIGQYCLDDILENCSLKFFGGDERKILYDAIERLFYCDSFKIGNSILPGDKVRSRLYELDYNMLETAVHNLHKNKDRPISNITGYVMSTVFNSITEELSLLHVDPYLNSIRGDGVCM